MKNYHSDGMLKEELIQVYEILGICCLDLPVSDYESVRIYNLCHKMTLHRIYILYTIFEVGKGYLDCCKVSMTIYEQTSLEGKELKMKAIIVLLKMF